MPMTKLQLYFGPKKVRSRQDPQTFFFGTEPKRVKKLHLEKLVRRYVKTSSTCVNFLEENIGQFLSRLQQMNILPRK